MNQISKIAFINYSLAGGGAERAALNLHIYLYKKNISVDHILIKNINEYKDEYKEGISKLHIISLLGKEKISWLLKPLKIFEIAIKLIFLSLKNKYKTIISFDHYWWMFAILSSKVCGAKNILGLQMNLSAHLKQKNILIRFLLYIWFKVSMLLSDLIICSSDGLKYDLISTFRIPQEKIKTIHNGIDMRMIKQKRIRREKSALFSGKITLITCGRLVEQKGYPYLIKAFRIVKNNIANIQLLILGKGPLETELKEQIKREHLIRDVKLLGFKNNPYFYYYHSDFFIFSSLYEGFGNVLVEAMACGLAIISTDCSYGPREIICSEETKYPSEKLQNYKICSYGILLPSLTISDSEKKIQFWAGKLTQAIKRLLKDKELLKKMRDMNVKRALLFDLDVMGKSYSTQLFPQNNH